MLKFYSSIISFSKRIANVYFLPPTLGDCHDSAGNEGVCVSAAIYNYTLQLSTAYNNGGSILESKCEPRLSLYIYILTPLHANIDTQSGWVCLMACFLDDRQFNGGTFVSISFCWGHPSGLIFLPVSENLKGCTRKDANLLWQSN